MGEPTRLRVPAAVLAVVALAVSACTGGGSSPTESAATSPAGSVTGSTTASTTGPSGSDPPTSSPSDSAAPRPALTADAAREILMAASFADPSTLDRVDAVKGDPAIVAVARDLAVGAAPGAARWALVYVLANATGQADVLAPFLTDDDLTIRVMAAVGAVGQGERAGFPVLVAALGNDDMLAGFEPPTSAWSAASLALARHTGLLFGPATDADRADRDDSTRRWDAWWAAEGPSIRFDPATEEWAS